MGESADMCGGAEYRGIEYTAALESMLRHYRGALTDRLKRCRALEDYDMALGAIERVNLKIFDSMDERQLARIAHTCQTGEVVVRQRPAAKVGEWQYVHEDDLIRVMEAAMRGTCALCVPDAKQANRCKLRKSMLRILAPDELSGTGCEYSRLMLGRPDSEPIVTDD